MPISVVKLKKLLTKPGYIDGVKFDSAVKKAKKQGKPIETVLLEEELIADDQLGRIIAEELGFKFVNLRKEKISGVVLNLIPELVARSKKVIAFAASEQDLKVGMLDPSDLETRHLIEKRAGRKVLPYFITQQDLDVVLGEYKPSLKEEFKSIMGRFRDESLGRDERNNLSIKMVDTLLAYGYENKASDIHIEPRRKEVAIRFRIDGVLHNVLEIPSDFYELILMRIKILSKMRTDEHRMAQDGKLRFKTGQGTVDIRVSVAPVTEGENVVMRLLSAKSRQFSLINLGLSGNDLKRVRQAMKRPHGMVLATGPTGCGKTTTLYSILKILNKPEIHIATIEDPVEYDIEGISQIQVNLKTNLTFAKGLRTIVRQDPDVIMVGEIRDEETAGIAVNSALTGHLVLSTLHTNDAATALPRLLDMGVEPFLVASTINVIVAQRLVRKICERCRVSYQLTKEEKKMIENESILVEFLKQKRYKNLDKLRLFRGQGCKVCTQTGFAGRIGIFEVLEMGSDVRELVISKASADKIQTQAIKESMTTMMKDGIEKVLLGVTTLEEILRVTHE